MASWLSSLVMCCSTRSRVIAGSSMMTMERVRLGQAMLKNNHKKKAESSQAMVIDNAAAGNCMVEPQLFPLNLNVNIRNDHLGETSLPKDPKSQPNVNDA